MKGTKICVELDPQRFQAAAHVQAPKASRRTVLVVPASIIAALILVLAVPAGLGAAKSCGAMQKELAQLRLEYHDYATGDPASRDEAIKFEKLVEILDKIIDLKRAMSETNCKIRPRRQDLNRKK